METRATKRQRITVESLQTKVEEFTKAVQGLQNMQQAEAQRVTNLIRDESQQNARRFQTMETRLTNAEKHFIHTNDKTKYQNTREEPSKKIDLSDLPKFKGIENPLAHIQAFKAHMSIKGVEKELWPSLFPLSLESVPQTWFFSMDPQRMNTFERIILEFSLQYYNNRDKQASKTTLEHLSQKDHEGLFEYLYRWREAILQVPNLPREDVLVTKFISSLRADYQVHMKHNHIENFRQLTVIGTRIEDDLRTGTVSKHVGRVYQGNNSKNLGHVAKDDDTEVVNVLNVLAVPAKDTSTKKKERRVYTPMQMTYAEAFKRLNKKNLLEPIGPTKDTPITERPTWWSAEEYCLYHRGKGHDTEKCFRLKNKIQDMIESGELPVPPRAKGAN